MSIKSRIERLERQRPAPECRCFMEAFDGTITGAGGRTYTREEIRQAEEAGDRVFLIQIVNEPSAI